MKKLVFVSLLLCSPVFSAAEPSVGKVCKASAAAIFGRDHKIMKLDRVTAGIAYVHYIRQNDNTRWAIKCRLEGNRIIWGSDNHDSIGRWRNHPLDSVVTYSVSGNKLVISENHSDGSESSEDYLLSEL